MQERVIESAEDRIIFFYDTENAKSRHPRFKKKKTKQFSRNVYTDFGFIRLRRKSLDYYGMFGLRTLAGWTAARDLLIF